MEEGIKIRLKGPGKLNEIDAEERSKQMNKMKRKG